VLMSFNSLARYAAEVQRNGFSDALHRLVVEQLVKAAIAVLDFKEASVSE